MTHRCLIDLVDAISLADGSRTIRELLADTKLPRDVVIVTEKELEEVLGEFLSWPDVKTTVDRLKEISK